MSKSTAFEPVQFDFTRFSERVLLMLSLATCNPESNQHLAKPVREALLTELVRRRTGATEAARLVLPALHPSEMLPAALSLSEMVAELNRAAIAKPEIVEELRPAAEFCAAVCVSINEQAEVIPADGRLN